MTVRTQERLRRYSSEDVLDIQPGSNKAALVDGGWAYLREIDFDPIPQYVPIQERRQKTAGVGSVAISGLTGDQANASTAIVTGGPHPEALDFSAPTTGLESRLPFVQPFPPTLPNTPDMY